MKKRFIVLPGLLLLTAASSMALSLGRHSGATLIGRPLDITVQAVLEAQDDVSGLCPEVDVFYADNRLDKSRVRVSIEKSASTSTQALIRIRSATLVDEPVVTIYLRVGCLLKTERRYVSLAELVSDVAPDRSTPAAMPSATPGRLAVLPPLNTTASTAEVATTKPARPEKPVKRSRAVTAAAAQGEPGNAVSAQALPALQLAEQAQSPNAKPRRAAATAIGNKTALPAKSRLRLEPLDLSIERDPQLKSSAELLSIPAANPQERAAASALWRALSAQPQDILRDTEKLQSLETSVRSLQAQSQKTLLSIEGLNLKLQQAQAERYANALVYSLLALLLVALASVAYLLRHRFTHQSSTSGDKPWWRKNEAYENQQAAWVDSYPSDEQHDLVRNDKEIKSSIGPVQKSSLVDVDVDFGLDLASSKSGGLRPATKPNFVDSLPFAHKDKSGFGPSMMQPSRAVKAEELFDVQQQADFFVSIGQHNQAIELLQSHIAENIETSALVYLDLFNLYHQLNRPTEYDSLRLAFNQRFNTQVPGFELYTDKNLGLESYQLALSRIEALWPSPKVLDIIEESLFRRPDTSAEAFNLEAYRELLMLYSVAKEIISPEPKPAEAAKKFDLPDRPADSVDSQPMSFKSTAIQPLSASMAVNQQSAQTEMMAPFVASTIPPASLRLGLDIDLSKLSPLDVKPDEVVAADDPFMAGLDTSASVLPDNGVLHADNLIDFDLFDVPQVESEKYKLPKT